MVLRKNLLMLIVLTIAVLVIFTGCTQKASNGTDSKDVKLKWVILAPGKQIDQQRVWYEFNKRLANLMPKTSVEFIGLTAAEFRQQWSLMSAADEKVDIVWSGYLLNYEQEIKNGNYIALDDLLQKSAKELKSSLPEWVWDIAKVDGKIYSVPNYQMMARGRWGFKTPKKLADKYLDTEKMQEIFMKNKTFTAEHYDVIEEYLEKLKEGNELQKGITPFLPTVDFKGYDIIGNDLVVKQGDKDFKVMYKMEVPEAKLSFKKRADWFAKGYIRKDSLSVGDTMKDDGRENGHVVWFNEVFKDPAEVETIRLGYPVEVIPISDYYFLQAYSTPATATSISRTSENPEVSIKLIELLNTAKGKELYNLLVYGFEGEHYKKINENRIETLSYTGIPDANSKYGLNKWVLGNTFNAYETQLDPDGYNDFIKNIVNEQSVKSPLLGFKPNIDGFVIEDSQIRGIKGEFLGSLSSGALGDKWEETFEQYMEKLKNAGIDRIKTEVQKQVDDYAKQKGLK